MGSLNWHKAWLTLVHVGATQAVSKYTENTQTKNWLSLCDSLLYQLQVGVNWASSLHVYKWNKEIHKTADNIKAAIINALNKFGLDEFFMKLVCVMDRETNLVAAYHTITRLSCSAHIFKTVLSTTLSKHLSTTCLVKKWQAGKPPESQKNAESICGDVLEFCSQDAGVY